MPANGGPDLAAATRAARRCLWAGEMAQARRHLLALSDGYGRRVYAGALRPDEAVAALGAALLARGPAGVQALVPALEASLDLYGDAGRLQLVAQLAAVALDYPSPPGGGVAPPLPPAEAAASRALQAIEQRDAVALVAALRARHALLELPAAGGGNPASGGDLTVVALAQLARHRGCPVPAEALAGVVPAALAETPPRW